MEETESNSYSEADIREIRFREHILLRPMMYVGYKGFRGYREMISYLLEDIADKNQTCALIEVEFHPGQRTLFKISNIAFPPFIDALTAFAADFVTVKPEEITLGLPVLCTLSSYAEITIDHAGEGVVFKGKNGVLETAHTKTGSQSEVIAIDFVCDQSVYGNFEIDYEAINLVFRKFALLNASLKIISTDLSSDELQRNVYCFPRGIFNEMDQEISKLKYGEALCRLDLEAVIDGYQYQISVCYFNGWPDKTFAKTYAQNIETVWGGSLEQGVLDGLRLAFEELMKPEKIRLKKKKLRKRLLLIAVVKGPAIVYAGSIKGKLDMPEMRKTVRQLVYERWAEYLAEHSEARHEIARDF